MDTLRRLMRDIVLAWLGVLLAGCAAVDPREDYGAVTQRVAEATGQSIAYRPDQADAVESHVEALLTGGLTADEAVRVCLLNNAAFQAAWMDVGMARADLVQSGLLSNPWLGGSLRLPAGGGLANVEVTLAQNIAEFWQIPVRRRVARTALDQVILRLARQAADLAADARAAYIGATAAEELHKVALDNLAIAHQLLELAIGRQEAGAGSELDVNLSRSAVLEAELSVEISRLAVSEARRGLAQLLGLAVDPERIALSDPLPSSSPNLIPVEDVIVVAREKRLDVRAAGQAVAQADARVREEYLRVFPIVELGVGMERAERKAQPGRNILADTARASIAGGELTAPEIQPRSERRQNTDFIIGPTWGLELPIFDQNQAQIAKAEYARWQAEMMFQSANQRMEQEVRSACDRMATAWRIVDTYRDRFIPLAQSNLDLSRESYKAGRASFLSVLESQRFFLDTRRRLIEAIQTAAAAIPALERAVGLPMAGFCPLRSNELPQSVDEPRSSVREAPATDGHGTASNDVPAQPAVSQPATGDKP